MILTPQQFWSYQMSKNKDLNQTTRVSNAHAAAQAPLASEKVGGIRFPLQDPQNLDAAATFKPSSDGEAEALRLEKRTNHNTGRYKIMLTDYGNGLGEIGWSFIHSYQPNKAERGFSENKIANQDRAVRRAKSRMRKLILSTKSDHLLTLTYRQNMVDFKQACRDLTKFIRLVRKDLPDWLYIAVAEKQKRGAWHWHLAVSGRQDVNTLRRAWLKVVLDGNIDVNPPKGKSQHRELALVSYLSKYLAKTFAEGDHELNTRRYRVSRGIEVPTKSVQLPDNETNAIQFALDTLQTKIGSVGHVWIAGDLAAGWACSWK